MICIVISYFFLFFFFLNDPPPTETSPLPLHDALPIFLAAEPHRFELARRHDRRRAPAAVEERQLPEEAPGAERLEHDARAGIVPKEDLHRSRSHDEQIGRAHV